MHYAPRGAMRKAEVEPLTRGWKRARPLEPLSVGLFQGEDESKDKGKHAGIAGKSKHSKKDHPF